LECQGPERRRNILLLFSPHFLFTSHTWRERIKKRKKNLGIEREDTSIQDVIERYELPSESENIPLVCKTFLLSHVFLLMHILFRFWKGLCWWSPGRRILNRYENVVLRICLNGTQYGSAPMVLHT
jgi:hypothetical protein